MNIFCCSVGWWIRLKILAAGLLMAMSSVALIPLWSSVAVATPIGSSAFSGMDPVRVLDTRQSSRPEAGSYSSLKIAGLYGVSSTATAVVLNVTATDASADGYVTVFPGGESLPNTSNLNVNGGGHTAANLVTVRVGSTGDVGLFTSVAANVVVDVFGFYSASGAVSAGRFIAMSPRRLLDTRGGGRVGQDGIVHLDMPGGIPSDTQGLVLNVTAVDSPVRSNGFGYWSAFPAGSPVPVTSNINISSFGQTVANQVIVKPSGSGVDFYSYAGGELIVDILGYYSGASAAASEQGLFIPVSPTRLLDTRSSPNPLGVNVALHHQWTVEVATAGWAGIPVTGASAVVVNVTMTRALGEGYITAHPAGRIRPDSSNLNADQAGMTAPNHVQVATGSRGIAFFSYGGTDLIVDVFGWFIGSPQVSTLGVPGNSLPESEGSPASISIPQIGLTSMVRAGTEFVNLDPSHLLESRSPSQPGNVAIFGHRVSHGHEFRNLDKLGAGSLVYLTVGKKIYSYRVTDVDIRLPSDPLLYASTSNDQTLSLVACHPPGSVKYRIVAHAVLFGVDEI